MYCVCAYIITRLWLAIVFYFVIYFVVCFRASLHCVLAMLWCHALCLPVGADQAEPQAACTSSSSAYTSHMADFSCNACSSSNSSSSSSSSRYHSSPTLMSLFLAYATSCCEAVGKVFNITFVSIAQDSLSRQLYH